VEARASVRRASASARGGDSGFAAFPAIEAPLPTLADVLLTVPAGLAAQLGVGIEGATRSAEAHLEGLQVRAVRAEEAAGARTSSGTGRGDGNEDKRGSEG